MTCDFCMSTTEGCSAN